MTRQEVRYRRQRVLLLQKLIRVRFATFSPESASKIQTNQIANSCVGHYVISRNSLERNRWRQRQQLIGQRLGRDPRDNLLLKPEANLRQQNRPDGGRVRHVVVLCWKQTIVLLFFFDLVRHEDRALTLLVD